MYRSKDELNDCEGLSCVHLYLYTIQIHNDIVINLEN